MAKVNWIDEILDFAIEREIEANEFYTDLAKRMETPAMREVFEDFAEEELGHKAKLEAVRKGEKLQPAKPESVQTLKIADYVVDVQPRPDMDYADALIVAMRKEKASYRLYLDLAEAVEPEEVKQTFLWLAGEEAKHKMRFEIEYDDVVLKED